MISKNVTVDVEYTHQYVTARDGVKLSTSLFYQGYLSEKKPAPILFAYDVYHQCYPEIAENEVSLFDTLLKSFNWLSVMVDAGFVVAVTDSRGIGASHGNWQGIFDDNQVNDTCDVIEWLSEQYWSNGKVGMFGRSYLGILQFFTAAKKPKGLKAILPEMAMFDLYSFAFPGGIFRHDYASRWSDVVKNLHNTRPVPNHLGLSSEKLASLRIEQQANQTDLSQFIELPYRDSKDAFGREVYLEKNPAALIEGINRSGIPCFLLCGWFDMWPKDGLLWFKNLQVPRKLVMGPWAHTSLVDATHHLQWFNYWLNETGDPMEPAHIIYYTMAESPRQAWKSTQQWPVENARMDKLYLASGPSNTVKSVNDGVLSKMAPTCKSTHSYEVDTRASSGNGSRWANGAGGLFDYFDMQQNDEKGLTYTSNPLTEDMEVTGHPIVQLWASASHPDTNFIVYLCEVQSGGFVQYISEGCIKFSHRKSCSPDYDNLNLPYFESRQKDIDVRTMQEPQLLRFDLLPTSYKFKAGSRIRLTIVGVDKDNYLHPHALDQWWFAIHQSPTAFSFLELPAVHEFEKVTQKVEQDSEMECISV